MSSLQEPGIPPEMVDPPSPFSLLPTDLLRNILSRIVRTVSSKDRELSISLVCREWMHLAFPAVHSIHINGYRIAQPPLSLPSLSPAQERYRQSSLILARLDCFRGFRRFASLSCIDLDVLSSPCRIDPCLWEGIARNCPNLTHVFFGQHESEWWQVERDMGRIAHLQLAARCGNTHCKGGSCNGGDNSCSGCSVTTTTTSSTRSSTSMTSSSSGGSISVFTTCSSSSSNKRGSSGDHHFSDGEVQSVFLTSLLRLTSLHLYGNFPPEFSSPDFHPPDLLTDLQDLQFLVYPYSDGDESSDEEELEAAEERHRRHLRVYPDYCHIPPCFLSAQSRLRVLKVGSVDYIEPVATVLPPCFTSLTGLEVLRLGEVVTRQADLLTCLSSFSRLHTLQLSCFIPYVLADPLFFCHMGTSLRHLSLVFYPTREEQVNLACSDPFSLPGGLQSLELLYHREVTFPCQLDGLDHLTRLNVMYANEVTSLPESLGSLRSLQQLQLRQLTSLVALPTSFGQLSSLEVLCINGCWGLQELEVGENELPQLAVVSVTGCSGLRMDTRLRDRGNVDFQLM